MFKSLEHSRRDKKFVVQDLNGKITVIKGQFDLRKMYTPPMKEQEMPSRNPFFNG